MKLSSVMDKRLILLDYPCHTYLEIQNTVVEKLSAVSGIPQQKLRDAFEDREHHGTTYVGHRLLLPHGYIDRLSDIYVLFMRLEKEISFLDDDRKRTVKYVFAVITSKQKAQLYLKVLKSIATLVLNFSHVLENAYTPEGLLADLDQKAFEVDETVTARELATSGPSVSSTDSVLAAVRKMESAGVAVIPVVDSRGCILGIIDLADLFTATYPERMVDPESLWLLYDMGAARDRLLEPVIKQWEREQQTPVTLMMKSADQYVIDANARYIDIVNHLTRNRHRYVIVIDSEKKVLGLIDSQDLVHHMIKA